MSIEIPPTIISDADEQSYKWLMHRHGCKTPLDLTNRGLELLYQIENLVAAKNSDKLQDAVPMAILQAPLMREISTRAADAIRAGEPRKDRNPTQALPG